MHFGIGHGSAGHGEIIWDGDHGADCDSSIPGCMADIRKMADKLYEGTKKGL